MTLKYRRLSSEGEALMPGAAGEEGGVKLEQGLGRMQGGRSTRTAG